MRQLGGLLWLAGAGITAWLWTRGYLTRGIDQVLAYFAQAPALRPIGSSSSTVHPNPAGPQAPGLS